MEHICFSRLVFYSYSFVRWTNIKSIFICWTTLPVVSNLYTEIFCLTINTVHSYGFKACRKCNNVRVLVIPACLINLTIVYHNYWSHWSLIVIVTGRRNQTKWIVLNSNVDLPSRQAAYRKIVSFWLSIIILTIIPSCNIICFVQQMSYIVIVETLSKQAHI